MSLADADRLREIAQNDYMIDNKFLPTGKDLNRIADAIEADYYHSLEEYE